MISRDGCVNLPEGRKHTIPPNPPPQKKLHEMERIWTSEGGGGRSSSRSALHPPMTWKKYPNRTHTRSPFRTATMAVKKIDAFPINYV